jgi:hypothetical protein
MLRLLAFAADDGWAFVREGQSVLLIRPPYRQANMCRVPEQSVETGVVEHGFSACDSDFEDWRGVIGFLNQQLRQSRESRGEQIVRQGLGEQMLQYASCDVLDKFLGRIETELLPAGSWEPAKRLLIDMLKLPQVGQNAEIHARVSDLFDRTEAARTNSETRRGRLLEQQQRDFVEQSPVLKKHYDSGQLADFNQRVGKRRTILPVGS